jgi:hypothetical protein
MRVRAWLGVAAGAALFTALASPVFAQGRGGAAAEGVVGYAGFLDDTTIAHTVWGGSARWYLLPRLAIGPELIYFRGPRDDRDVVVTGNLTFDFLAGAHPVTPFVVGGGGFFRHRDKFGGATFTSTEGSFTGGAGVRLSIGRQFYVAPEFRIGWEPHVRISVAAGWRFDH